MNDSESSRRSSSARSENPKDERGLRAKTGKFIEACRIDLPENDVVESIDFERFFRMNLQMDDLQGAATLPIDFPRSKVDLSSVNRSVPLSAEKADWEKFRNDFSKRSSDLTSRRLYELSDRGAKAIKNEGIGDKPGENVDAIFSQIRGLGGAERRSTSEVSDSTTRTLSELIEATTGDDERRSSSETSDSTTRRRFERSEATSGDAGRVSGSEVTSGTTERSSEVTQATERVASLLAMPLALYMPYRQEWTLLGHSRGRLVNSFTLGPQEEQTIEIFKWDRITRSMDSTTTFEFDQTTERSSTRRDTSDVARDITRDTGFEAKTGGTVGFTVGVVNADFTAGADASVGVNEAERSTRNAISEATTRASGRVRTSRTLKVVESREYGQETRITRRLRNANNCHALTIAFFEILANYQVTTRLRKEGMKLVVLIHSSSLEALRSFHRKDVRAHETALRLALMDARLADGFDAARFLEARDRACAILCQGCSCGEAPISSAVGAEWTNLTNVTNGLGQAVSALRSYFVRFPISILESVVALPAGVTDIKRYLFFKSLNNQAPRLLGDLAGLNLTAGAASLTISQVESVAQILATVPDDAMAKLSYDKQVSDAVFNEIYGFFLAFIFHEFIASLVAAEIVSKNVNLNAYDDMGLIAAIAAFKSAYGTWKAFLQSQLEKDEKAAALQKIRQEERELRVLDAYSLRETADAQERLEALLTHLNDPRNLDHYRFAIWNERSGGTDPVLMSMALAGLIEPTPVGTVGDQLAVPVKLKEGSKLRKFYDGCVRGLEGAREDQAEHILPTPALYTESIVGECCSCEETIVKSTKLDLDRREIDNKLVTLESERIAARLKADPPMLDREFGPGPAIKVDVTNDSAAGDTPDS